MIYPNKVVGKLRVHAMSSPSADGSNRWVCRCSCGNTATVSEESLLDESVKSCGCVVRGTPSLYELGQKKKNMIQEVKKSVVEDKVVEENVVKQVGFDTKTVPVFNEVENEEKTQDFVSKERIGGTEYRVFGRAFGRDIEVGNFHNHCAASRAEFSVKNNMKKGKKKFMTWLVGYKHRNDLKRLGPAGKKTTSTGGWGNKTGINGVTLNAKGQYRVRVRVSGRVLDFGNYDNLERAKEVREKVDTMSPDDIIVWRYNNLRKRTSETVNAYKGVMRKRTLISVSVPVVSVKEEKTESEIDILNEGVLQQMEMEEMNEMVLMLMEEEKIQRAYESFKKSTGKNISFEMYKGFVDKVNQSKEGKV